MGAKYPRSEIYWVQTASVLTEVNKTKLRSREIPISRFNFLAKIVLFILFVYWKIHLKFNTLKFFLARKTEEILTQRHVLFFRAHGNELTNQKSVIFNLKLKIYRDKSYIWSYLKLSFIIRWKVICKNLENKTFGI